MSNINIPAEGIGTTLDDGNVTLRGVNIEDIVAEFNVKEVLDALDFGDVHDYVIDRFNEEDDE